MDLHDEDMHRWWKAESSGEKNHLLGVRITAEECEHLEQLRQRLRLRSGSEVVRFALQVVECACSGRRFAAESADEVVANVEECLGTKP